MRRARAGLALALVAAVVLAARTAREGGILGAHDRLLAEVMGFWAAWLVAVGCLLRSRLRGRALVLVLGTAAVALRVAALSPVVPLSDDLYRYAWDGSVQAAGVSPYRYAPAEDPPELRDRRTDWLFPGAVQGGDACADTAQPEGCTRINRPSVRTIYPPVAQAWFLAGHLVGASHLRDLGWQLVALVPDAVTCVLLGLLLVRRGRDPAEVAWFAWSPVAVLEGVQNGHVDGLATVLVVLAVWAAARRPTWAGAALGAAAMVKLYPALLLPALLGRRPLRVLAAFAGVCAATYLPHVLAVGPRVIGFLPGYLREEDYDAGARYLLLRPLALSGAVATVVVALAGLGVAALVLRRVQRSADDVPAAACLLLGAALLLATPVQPWYGLPLAALAVAAGRPAWLAVPAAAYPLFFAVVPDGPSSRAAELGSACYLVALAVVGADAVRRRRVPARA